MNEVIRILMDRDGLSEQEARDLIAETREAMEEAMEDSPGEAEAIFEEMLGLEPDYILDIL